MEWDLFDLYSGRLYDIPLNIVAVRDHKFLYFGHKMVMEVYSMKNLCLMVYDLVDFIDLEVSLILPAHRLSFPTNYNIRTL